MANTPRLFAALEDQPLPPTIINGFNDWDSLFTTSLTFFSDTICLGGSIFGASFISNLENRTSSGSESTTGPGRPDWAILKALEIYSGILSVLSIWATHFANGENIFL